NRERHTVGSQSGTQAEVSSSAEEARHLAVWFPCFPAWQCYAARSDWCAHGGPPEPVDACRAANYHGLYARSYGRRTQDGRRTWENSARYCTEQLKNVA